MELTLLSSFPKEFFLTVQRQLLVHLSLTQANPLTLLQPPTYPSIFLSVHLCMQLSGCPSVASAIHLAQNAQLSCPKCPFNWPSNCSSPFDRMTKLPPSLPLGYLTRNVLTTCLLLTSLSLFLFLSVWFSVCLRSSLFSCKF